MADKENLASTSAGDAPTAKLVSDVALLPLTASNCGVTTVPLPILTAMFDKANHPVTWYPHKEHQITRSS